MPVVSGVDLVENNGQLNLRHQPVADRPPVQVDLIRDMIAEAGCAHWCVLDDALTEAVRRCNQEEAAFELTVAERRDASFELEIADDAMSAWLWLTPAKGGADLTPNDLVQAMAEAGVVFGVDLPALQQLCASNQGGRVLAAQGKPPKPGEDARFELLVDVTRDRSPKVDEHGLIDFRELGDIPLVEAGQSLMRVYPATAGILGRNIRAEVLEPVPGRPGQFPDNLTGACVAENDKNLLCAAVKGQPVRVDNGVMVEQVVHFSGASIASGNISFDGTVHVDGDVLNGMKVQATGDIVVTGTVEGGHLEAGGSIKVFGGIIAHAHLHAGDSVSARFVENSEIDAGVGIAIDDMALQSQLQAGNQIVIGIEAPKRGRLVGGSARAMMLIRTPLLGDPASAITQVLVGVNPALEAEYQEVLRLLEKQRVEEENLNKLIQHLTKQGDKTGLLNRAQATWQQLLQAMGDAMSRKEDLDKQMAMVTKAQVDIGVGLSGAVDLAFGKTVRPLRRGYDSGSFSMEDGLILFTPKDGDSAEVNG
ncbi:MAG: DUF342 domain-containing protein [Rubrivivax sp.]|nr:MAG: DUF342 domain-containing protein [Rubrivivax sp.]